MIPEWYEKLIKRVFLVFGLYVAGSIAVKVVK